MLNTDENEAKNELLKKYGNTRMDTDNPFDIIDAFNVIVNRPEIGTFLTIYKLFKKIFTFYEFLLISYLLFFII